MDKKRHVPFFNYAGVFAEFRQEYTRILHNILERGAFIQQSDLESFENNLAHYLGVKHAIGVANCTDALIIALRLIDLRPDDEVIVPSHTFVATASAVHMAGGTPVLTDCGPDHLMDPSSARAAVSSKTRAIIPVQLNGRTCRMDDLQAIARENNLIIIEDSAQALGSRYKGKPAGTFGLAGTYSFYPAKSLNCFGDGGALVTNDDSLAEKVRLMRDHGRNGEGEIMFWGLNSRLDNLQAAILNFKLARYPLDIQRRREVAALYQQKLGDLKELKLPPAPGSESDYFDIFQNYEIEASRRDELKMALHEDGVDTLIQWNGKPIHHNHELKFQVRLPRTDALFASCLMLPMNTMITNEDVDYICKRIRHFYGR